MNKRFYLQTGCKESFHIFAIPQIFLNQTIQNKINFKQPSQKIQICMTARTGKNYGIPRYKILIFITKARFVKDIKLMQSANGHRRMKSYFLQPLPSPVVLPEFNANLFLFFNRLVLYHFRGQISTEIQCKNFFLNYVNVYTWGDTKFFGGQKPLFLVSREIRHLEEQILCQSIKKHMFSICS